MDPGVFVHKALQNMYKAKPTNFATTHKRATNINNQRRISRTKVLNQRRHLSPSKLTPIITPNVKPQNNAKVGKPEKLKQAQIKTEKLQKWKQEKAKRLQQQKAKTKPPFKVYHVNQTVHGIYDISKANVELKGKPISFAGKKMPNVVSLVPPNYTTFQAPQNIKPVAAFGEKTTKSPRSKLPLKFTDNLKRVTRSQQASVAVCTNWKVTKTVPKNVVQITSVADVTTKDSKNVKKPPGKVRPPLRRQRNVLNSMSSSPELGKKVTSGRVVKSSLKVTKSANKVPKIEIERVIKEERLKKNREGTRDKSKISNDSVCLEAASTSQPHLQRSPTLMSNHSPEYSFVSAKSTTDSPARPDNVPITPVTKPLDDIIYISPFVTLSRGKKNARDEYHARRSKDSTVKTPPPAKIDALTYTSPKAGARYFSRLLDSTIVRIQSWCNDWTTYQKEKKIPEEASDMIDLAVGQSQLLISKKFEQFRGLINSCALEDGEQAITCEDLHGFWDMVYLQVVNLEKRFHNLILLRTNNWVEVVNPVQTKPKKRVARPRKAAAPKATVALKAALKEARNKNVKTNRLGVENLLTSMTPEKRTPGRKSTHDNLRKSILSGQGNQHLHSPLAMMKVAQLAKSVQKAGRAIQTPGKSILKNPNVETTTSKSKAVLFRTDEEDNIDFKMTSLNDENDGNTSNLMDVDFPSVNAGGTPYRRSQRLSRKV